MDTELLDEIDTALDELLWRLESALDNEENRYSRFDLELEIDNHKDLILRFRKAAGLS